MRDNRGGKRFERPSVPATSCHQNAPKSANVLSRLRQLRSLVLGNRVSEQTKRLATRARIGLQPLDRRTNFVGRHSHHAHEVCHDIPQTTMRCQSTLTAHKLHAAAALEALPAGHRDEADTPGGWHMGAAARRQIETIDFHEP